MSKGDPAPCPTKRKRYRTRDSAMAHWRTKGHDVVPCATCGGYHLERRAPTTPPRSVEVGP